MGPNKERKQKVYTHIDYTSMLIGFLIGVFLTVIMQMTVLHVPVLDLTPNKTNIDVPASVPGDSEYDNIDPDFSVPPEFEHIDEGINIPFDNTIDNIAI